MSEQVIAEKEEWRPVKGFEERYSVSNFGRVRGDSKYRQYAPGRILPPQLANNGYHRVHLYAPPNIHKFPGIHRLVLIAFIGLDPKRPYCNHKNGIKTFNYLENLEWVTCSENRMHALNVLGIKPPRGERHHGAIITDAIAVKIWSLALEGNTASQIREFTGVNRFIIASVLSRQAWTHATDSLPSLNPLISGRNSNGTYYWHRSATAKSL